MIRNSLLLISSLSLILCLTLFVNTKTVVLQSYAQACAAPAAATGVTVEFPGCTGTACVLTQASCKWNAQADAASYNVTVTELETGTVIKNNESVVKGSEKIVFPITQKKTYKCDVVSVSACGGLAAAASDQLLCEADALINTPTPTIAPTATRVPPTATPTIAKPGGIGGTIALAGGILLAIIGGIVLLIL